DPDILAVLHPTLPDGKRKICRDGGHDIRQIALDADLRRLLELDIEQIEPTASKLQVRSLCRFHQGLRNELQTARFVALANKLQEPVVRGAVISPLSKAHNHSSNECIERRCICYFGFNNSLEKVQARPEFSSN